MSFFPTVNDPLKCLHKENAGSTGRIEHLQVPDFSTPWKNPVQNEVHKMRWRIENTVGPGALANKGLVDAADEFQRNSVEGIFSPKMKLALRHVEPVADRK